MDLRVRTLDHLDDRAVPLPHGTEVVTRVDRIVGVGVVRYVRGELSPRRVGQVLFAQRRADTWEAFGPQMRDWLLAVRRAKFDT